MVTNESIDATLHALAHTTRREILDYVQETPGLPVGVLAGHFEVSRIAIMNHLSVLERAHLIISEKDGRTRRLYFNLMPIQEIHERWTDTYSAYWTDRMSMVKAAAEAVVQASSEERADLVQKKTNKKKNKKTIKGASSG